MDGNYNGQGTYTAPDGSKYAGEWKDDKRHGLGINTYSDGRPSLEGIWADGKFVRAEKITPQNQQTDSALNEEHRRSEVAKNQQGNLPTCQGSDATKWRNCFGTYTTANGTKYVGQFKDGKEHGQGTDDYADGGKYVGQFKDGEYHGQGTFTSAVGDNYVGQYKDGKLNGQATYTNVKGAKYVGQYKDGQPNGKGTFTFSNGDKYVGEFKDGNYHGRGVETYADGSPAKEGIWADDKFVRAEKIDTKTQAVTSEAASKSLHENFEAAKEATNKYDSLRLRSVNEGVLYKCGGVTYNFLEGFVFFYDYSDNPPGAHIPQKPYVLNNDLVTWYWTQEEIYNKDGMLYRIPAMKAELNLTAKTLVYEDGDKIFRQNCIDIDITADVRKRKTAAAKRVDSQKNLPEGGYKDIGNGYVKWYGKDGVNPDGSLVTEGTSMVESWLDKSWNYSLGRKK